ncbi:MAG: CBS domain-containing protein [Chloroflexota bacterium]|nr:MAG: CBS domain-containing protein [Chloroflexota bacterium]
MSKPSDLNPSPPRHMVKVAMPEDSLPNLVRDLMTVGVLTCTPQTTIPELAQLLLENDLDQIVVLDDGRALGVVGQEELLKAFAEDQDEQLKATDVMREGVPQIPPDIPLRVAAQLMRDQGTRTFFLMHHASGIEYPAAAISYKHYLRLLAAKDLDELRDLGIKAERTLPLDEFIQRREATRKKISKQDS